MLNQKFTAKSLLKITTLDDIIKFKLGRDRDEYLEKLEQVAHNINNGSYDFSDFTAKKTTKHSIIKSHSIEGTYSLRHISKIICRLYKVKQSNREIIAGQVKTLLEDTSQYSIIKGDIKSFFESIPRDKVSITLTKDRLLSYRARTIIEKLFSSPALTGVSGLPRGVSLSSPLSELYIRDFDRFARAIPGVYYYARYVDDFIIFCHTPPNEIKKAIEKNLSELSLCINYKKLQILPLERLEPGDTTLTFLGYQFRVIAQDNKNSIEVSISKKRICRIKTRIILALLDYAKSKDVELLKDRIRFLSGNYRLHQKSRPDDSGLMAGFYYNNKLANNSEQIASLDNFLMKSITSKKGGIYRRIGRFGMQKIKTELKGLSFTRGFKFRKSYTFDMKRFSQIKNCWKQEFLYEKN